MFKKAERKKAKLRLGVSGPAGSGKTFSALKMAFGLGGKVALIDTEHGSGDLYADIGDYDVAVIDPPFTPDKYVELIKEAGEKYDTVIVDSLSHAWAGEGGLLDLQDKITKTSKSRNSYMAWREVTPKHNALVNAMLQSPAHIIATIRSKQDYILDESDGKKTPKKVGMAPVQREGMEYEFTVFLELCQEHLATVSKDRTRLFDGQGPFVPSEETGKVLLRWLEGQEKKQIVTPVNLVPLHPVVYENNPLLSLEQCKRDFWQAYKASGYPATADSVGAYILQETKKQNGDVTAEEYLTMTERLRMLKQAS